MVDCADDHESRPDLITKFDPANAAAFQPSDEGATIANQFGYGAELSTV
jgi:hypothetical protein